MGSPELNSIEIGNTLEEAENLLIAGLKLEAFDVDNKKENKDELKAVLKDVKIKVSDVDKNGNKKEKTLSEIADDFTTYVEK